MLRELEYLISLCLNSSEEPIGAESILSPYRQRLSAEPWRGEGLYLVALFTFLTYIRVCPVDPRYGSCVSKLNQHEDKIEDLYALFDELKTKKFKWRRSYVELIEKVMKFLAENPEIIARIGTTIEDVDVALDQIQAGKPDLNNDGKVSNLEKLLYETIGFLMKKEKLWFIITHAVMLLGGCGLGLYLGSIL